MALAIAKKRRFFGLANLFRARRNHGDEIRELIDRLETLPHSNPEVIAFRLTLDRIRRSEDRPRSSCRDLFCAACVNDALESYDDPRGFLAFYRRNLDETRSAIQYMRKHDRVRVKAKVA